MLAAQQAPSPLQKKYKKTQVPCSPSGPLVALAFKLEEGRYGQLTYMRLYSGTLRKGDTLVNTGTGKRVRVPRVVRIHSDELEDIASARAGDIVAIFGVDCASGDTFTDGSAALAMSSIRVPEPVMSVALTPKYVVVCFFVCLFVFCVWLFSLITLNTQHKQHQKPQKNNNKKH